MMGQNIDFDPRADYYKTLGVKKDASDAQLKKAYRELAKKYHPDATGGDKAKEVRFKEVSKAYDILGNKEKRAQYDAYRTGGFASGPGAGSPQGFGGGAANLGDLFSQMFGGMAGGQAPAGGYAPGGGNVRYEVISDDGPGASFNSFNSFFTEAPRQRVRRQRRKPEAPAEHKIRASDGSVLVQKGTSVYSDVRLHIDEALLGTTKQVATLGGKATIKVPPGTSSGTKLRLRGKGVPKAGGGRGDHYVTVQIDIPKKKLDAKTQKLLADLMKRLR
jgi:DnaJ-class molecular chaperone